MKLSTDSAALEPVTPARAQPSMDALRKKIQDLSLTPINDIYFVPPGMDGSWFLSDERMEPIMAAVQSTIEQEALKAFELRGELDSADKVYESLANWGISFGKRGSDSITDFMYSLAPDHFYNKRLEAQRQQAHKPQVQQGKEEVKK